MLHCIRGKELRLLPWLLLFVAVTDSRKRRASLCNRAAEQGSGTMANLL